MIQPLRTAHRRLFLALAFLLPAILLAGLGARPKHPASSGSSVVRVPPSFEFVKASPHLLQKHELESKFYRDPNRPGEVAIVFNPVPEWTEPDLLVYWSPDAVQGDTLPAHAQLIGPFAASKAFLLPSSESGTLILFSLPHQSVFDTARVGELP
jgi:hypothetical protein